MAEIKLPCGRVALVDDADVALLANYNLYSYVWKGRYYINARPKPGSKKKRANIHKIITRYKMTDHKNGNGLDNRRQNLRPCTHAENMRNSRKRMTNCTNKFKGSFWHKGAQKWMAQICVDCKRVYGGLFNTAKEAATAYDALARKYHGEFARLNFPDANG